MSEFLRFISVCSVRSAYNESICAESEGSVNGSRSIAEASPAVTRARACGTIVSDCSRAVAVRSGAEGVCVAAVVIPMARMAHMYIRTLFKDSEAVRFTDGPWVNGVVSSFGLRDCKVTSKFPSEQTYDSEILMNALLCYGS